MASGTINGTTNNQYIIAKVEWSSVANHDANTSVVTASLYYKRTNTGYVTSGRGDFYITINGVSQVMDENGARYFTIGENWTLFGTHSVTVTHNSDGKKSITISASGGMWDESVTLQSTNLSGTAVLDTIARASTLDSLSCATTYFTGTMTYKYTPQVATLYNRCLIYLYTDGETTFNTLVKDIKLGQKAASQQTATVTFSESELSTIYNKLPSTTKAVLRFLFYTYYDSGYSDEVNGATSKLIELNIPNNDSTKPTATLSVSPVNSLASPFNTMYIKGKSKITADLTNRAGKYGATITSYTVQIEGSGGQPPFTSEYITKDGEITVIGTLTDTRGFTRKYTKTVTFLPYINPRIIPASGESAVVCERCDASGNIKEDGTYLKIKAKRSYSSLNSKNTCSIRYRYKPDGGSFSSWTTILEASSASDEVTTGALLGGGLLTTSSYTVQIGVIDALGETDYTSIFVSTASVYMHRAGSRNSLGIGKYVEDDNVVDIAQDITAIFRGDVQFMGEAWNSLPLGTNVVASEVNSGRWGGSGVYYRVCAGGKHIYVAFNVSFTTSSSTVRAESSTIPYPPNYDVYALCPVGFADNSRGIATVSISPKGRVNIYAVHKLPGATLSSGDTVKWIDGYIDYWT